MSLCEQRERLRREVDELEQQLSASNIELLEISSDDSDGDSSVDTGQETGELTAGLLAKKEEIQMDIQKLENLLGPIVVSDDDSSDSSGESELGLTTTVESCLQMNLVYQQILEEKLKQLETFLAHNQRQQREVQFHLSGSGREPLKEDPSASASSAIPKRASLFLGHFLKPYFKDKVSGLGPPPNQDTKEKMLRMKGCLDSSKMKVKRWKSWQKTLLIHSVNTDCLKKLVQPKLSRMDYLSQKLSSSDKSEEEKQQLKMHLENLEKDIEGFKVKKEDELVGGRDEEHDWHKIAKIDFEGTREADDLRLFWQNFLHPAVNKNLWSADEVERLKEISERNKESNWELVAQELGTGRTAFMCLQTFQRFISTSLKRGPWTAAEDRKFIQMVEKMRIGNFIPYTQISYFMEGRDTPQLIHRWTCILDPRLKKGTWSKEEDQLLLNAVARHGEKNWWKIRLEVPGRTDGSCRDRYLDCLKKGNKKGAFDRHERQLLVRLIEKHGEGHWAKIAAEIPNRSDAHCLREWKKMMRHTNEPTMKRRRRAAPETAKKSKMRARVRKRLRQVQEDEEDSCLEEDEDEHVHYMDTDEENEEDEEDQEEEEGPVDKKEAHFPIPPAHQWIPLEESPKSALPEIKLVTLDPGGGQSEAAALRSTVAMKSGSSTTVGPPPRELKREERYVGSTALMISEEQLRLYLGRQACKCNKRRSLPKKGHVTDMALDWRLQAAVLPWVGNVLTPYAAPSTASTLADALGRETAVSSTPIFKLLLRAMGVDISGCKDVILGRGQEKVTRGQLPPTPPPGKTTRPPQRTPAYLKNPASVAAILHANRTRLQHGTPLVCLKTMPPAPALPPLPVQPQARPLAQMSRGQRQILPRGTPLSPAVCLLTAPPSPSGPSQALPAVPFQSQTSQHLWRLVPATPFTAPPVCLMTRPPVLTGPAGAQPSLPVPLQILPPAPPAHPPVRMVTTPPVSVSLVAPPPPSVTVEHGPEVPPAGKKRAREEDLPDQGKRKRKLTEKALQSQASSNKRKPRARCGSGAKQSGATPAPAPPAKPPVQNVVFRLLPLASAPSPALPHDIDPSLVSLGSTTEFGNWLRGPGGTASPQTGTSLPYLPPCCANLKALAAIFRDTRRLSSARKLVRKDTPPDQTVHTLRTLVKNRLASDPVFLLLKARFVSAFTLPALAAAIPTFAAEQKKEKTGQDTVRTLIAPPAQLACDNSGAPADHFPGMGVDSPALSPRRTVSGT
ncbi:snRNA-activating protein complex subunit 4 isoform X2 [Corythoichthys intestinalis]|uniref:snRNA-activating protein complex subunit 4 isoform X2 n=1 Tax=Corythoichthys intestinalis TaxID=161448 RepID=UPI0025A59885|nr:snRNA-activating protein complex subunit 4 isoform X2 [Corythoichthys intestinalis]